MRTKSLFNNKIKCFHCDSNFKLKKERGVNKYICTKYDNIGKCIRIPILEDFLVDLIEKRMSEVVSRELIDEHIEKIVIEDIDLLEIFVINQESILLSRTHLRY